MPLRRNSSLKKGGIKKWNAARRKKEFARAYGSKERVAWIRSLPCVACGVKGFSENAHVASGGTGRKADASQIVPLCGPRYIAEIGVMAAGCHRLLHATGGLAPVKLFKPDLLQIAANIETVWQEQLHASERSERVPNDVPNPSDTENTGTL